MTNDESMSHERIRVCKKHKVSFSEDCMVCKLMADRDELVRMFWFLTKACENSYNEKDIKGVLDNIVKVGRDVADRFKLEGRAVAHLLDTQDKP
jgi:hypothetical protein